MDNNTQTQQPTITTPVQNQVPVQSTPINTTTPVIPAPKSRKPMIIALIVGILVIIGLVSFLLLQGNKNDKYTLVIEDTTVASKDIEDIYSYYEQQEGFDSEETLTNIKQLYLENYVLKQEAQDSSDTPEESISDIQGAPTVLNTLIKENTRLKNQIVPTINISERSGVSFRISVAATVSAAQKQALGRFSEDRLTFYRTKLENGESIDAVKREFFNDSTIKRQTQLQSALLPFTDMEASRPMIPNEIFTTEVYSIPQNSASNVFMISTKDEPSYYLVYVSSVNEGEYEGYREWISEKTSGLKVESNI
jgi:hypothetical protein